MGSTTTTVPADADFHWWLSMALLASGLAACVVLLLGTPAPYGRYAPRRDQGEERRRRRRTTWTNWGPLLPAGVAWVAMESPNLWVTALCLVRGSRAACLESSGNRLLLALFVAHYLHRALIYPLLMPPGSSPMPLSVCLMAFAFCTTNGYLQARYLTALHAYPDDWLASPQCIAGLIVFAAGLALNIHADSILRRLRQRRQQQQQQQQEQQAGGHAVVTYEIPRGGLFEYVSAANYVAEMAEWAGFAIACGGSYPALLFATFTVMNLAPRALSHHRFYVERFGNRYPRDRKALIPFVF